MRLCLGKVYVVGAGPGDPGLITVKGLRLLRRADTIVYDRLAPRELLGEAKQGCRLIYVGKAPGRHTMSQDEINRLLLEEACRGGLVVRLKGGDPYLYGRGEEECVYLTERNVDCEVVPGVPSAIAVPAYAGIPVTSRWMASTLAIAPGRLSEGKGEVDYRTLAAVVDTLVILMGASRAAQILREVAEARGWEEPAAIIMNGTTSKQRVITGTLAELREKALSTGFTSPAIIVVGRVVTLRERIWKAA